MIFQFRTSYVDFFELCLKKSLAIFGLFIAVLLLTRGSQFPLLNMVLAPYVIVYLFASISIESRSLDSIIPISIYCALSSVLSIFKAYDVFVIIRFFTIIIATLLAFETKPMRIFSAYALSPVAFQAVLISSISLFLTLNSDLLISTEIRNFVLNEGIGDIYSFDGLYYHVQVIGNALIPLLFLICLWSDYSVKYRKFGLLVSVLGLIAAGNLTYFITLGVSVIFKYWKIFLKKKFEITLIITLFLIFTQFENIQIFNDIWSAKFEGSDSSMSVRYDQINAYARVVEESPTVGIFGAGIGAPYPDGVIRKYSGSFYIELQALYIIYQIGLIGAIVYLVSFIYYVNRSLSFNGGAVLFFFMICGITNPYIFDSNQIISTILLVHLFPRKK
jgi:hypothetical protein